MQASGVFLGQFIGEFMQILDAPAPVPGLPITDPIIIVLLLMATALIVPFIARRLHLPDIVFLIIAGILLGPHGAGILSRDQDAVALFAVVGILSLMFLAGLEIDIREYRKNRSKSIVFGALTFCTPMTLGFLSGMYLLDMSLLQSVLLASLLSSHTLLAYPVISRLRIGSDESVAVTVGGTIITDVAALLVLSAVVSMHTGEMTSAFIIESALKLFAFMFFELILLPRIASRALEKLENDGRKQFLFVFVVLFGSAFLAELAGIEPIIGAFMSGIALGRFVPPVSPLGNRIDFFGSTIFIPAFLISVGMLVDLAVIFADLRTVYVAVVMTLAVILAKWLAAFFTQKIFSWSRERCGIVFGLSVGQAAATLAAVTVGYKIGLFGHDVLNGSIVTIFVTALLGPLVAQIMGKRIAREMGQLQAEQDFSRRRILIGAEEKAGSERLLEVAIMLHDPKGITDMRAVTILDSSRDTPKRVEAIGKHLSHYAKEAAAAGHKIEFGPRISPSVAMGLANGAGEFSASDIVIGFSAKRTVFGPHRSPVLDELVQRSGTRILASRLFSPLATMEKMTLLLPAGIELEEDFQGTLITLKSIALQSRSVLTCCGSAPGLALARTIFEASPSLAGILWEECGHEDLIRRIRDTEGVRCIVLARQEGASWSREMRQMKQLAYSLPRDVPVIIMFPSIKRESSAPGTVPEALGRIRDIFRNAWRQGEP
ncbi:MAG: cation:proton antiporter [Spirochaetota bacterium]|jgi:Kef-type K+ transport system membrane component KefB|nr:cation:proton antiporter [Spirochaetota bacterium]